MMGIVGSVAYFPLALFCRLITNFSPQENLEVQIDWVLGNEPFPKKVIFQFQNLAQPGQFSQLLARLTCNSGGKL